MGQFFSQNSAAAQVLGDALKAPAAGAAYPVLKTALTSRETRDGHPRVRDSALSSIYGSLWYSMATQYVARAALAFRAPC